MKPFSVKKLFKPSPFKIGLLIIVLCNFIFFSFGGKKPELLESLDNQLIDAMFQLRGSQKTTGEIVIIDIDERSLHTIGQWPWPRNIVASLTEKIAAAGANSIGFDILFAEKDRTSPQNSIPLLVDLLQQDLPPEKLSLLNENAAYNYDLLLGDTVANSPSVLGYFLQTVDDGINDNIGQPFPSADIYLKPEDLRYDELYLITASRAVLNTDDIEMAPTEGFINVFPDSSGTVRKVPLFMKLNDIPYPSLALEMVRIGLGLKEVTIHASRQKKGNKHSLLGISLGETFIPTDDKGQITVNYRGPSKTFPYISAVDILQDKNLDQLKDKYVLIGASAAGLLDLRATPFSSVFAGVEVHANVIDNILNNDPLIHDIYTEIGLTYTVITIGGILLASLLSFFSPLIGGLGGATLITVYILYGNYNFFFLQNQLVGITYPIISIFNIFLFVTLFNYAFKDREKRYIQGAFGHYVSPQVVKELMKRPENLSLTGEERKTTILFSDIRNFTTISERINSQELGAFMNTYLTAMSDLIMHHGGMVDKYIGDAIMALWGVPLSDDRHAEKCVRAALHMIQELQILRPQWIKQGLPEINIGIGINTGIANVGNFGSQNRFDYTAIGDNVNLASRLESLNKMYGTNLLITETTQKTVAKHFFCRFVDKIRVKGKENAVILFEPLTEGSPTKETLDQTALFDEAIEKYHLQRFNEAKRIFQELSSQTGDPLYSLYLERVKIFTESPLPPDWDGVYTATSK